MREAHTPCLSMSSNCDPIILAGLCGLEACYIRVMLHVTQSLFSVEYHSAHFVKFCKIHSSNHYVLFFPVLMITGVSNKIKYHIIILTGFIKMGFKQ